MEPSGADIDAIVESLSGIDREVSRLNATMTDLVRILALMGIAYTSTEAACDYAAGKEISDIIKKPHYQPPQPTR